MITMTAQLIGDAALKQVKAVQGEWKQALLAEGKAIKDEYSKTTATWKHHVTFNIKPKLGKDEWYVDVWAKNRIYWFVHEGIAVMHAVLSKNWLPKTERKVLGSGPGRGRVVRIRPDYEGPRYEARKFTDTIVKVRKKPFLERMKKATEDAIKTP